MKHCMVVVIVVATTPIHAATFGTDNAFKRIRRIALCVVISMFGVSAITTCRFCFYNHVLQLLP